MTGLAVLLEDADDLIVERHVGRWTLRARRKEKRV
jgi:hypothetical protein